MKLRQMSFFGCVLSLTALGSLATAEEESKIKPVVDIATQVAEGRDLFVRDWLKNPPDGSTADGLGPMYNDVSCIGCHSQGGVGGGGPLKKNVDLLHVISPVSRGVSQAASFERTVKRAHPDFGFQSKNVILHRFGRDKQGTLGTYRRWRNKLLDIQDREKFTATSLFRKVSNVRVRLTQRNTPALFGTGIIDSIPDSVFIEQAEKQKRNRRGVSGRVPQTARGSVGRFGWRGQIATLQEFVETACAAELGLSVPKHRQSMNPIEKSKQSPRLSLMIGSGLVSTSNSRVVDLTQAQCDSLTRFVASLPAPERVRDLHLEDSKLAIAGQKLFEKIGCADCHVQDMGPAKGIYSDLLLHDMGRRLADPLAAMPELSREDAINLSGYYGVSSDDILAKATTHIRREWRTPPLWGVRDSAPYLHDGRAADLETAILMHEGEAQVAAKGFKGLKRKQRDQVVLFLNSLVTPGAKADWRNQHLQNNAFGGGGFFSVSDQSK